MKSTWCSCREPVLDVTHMAAYNLPITSLPQDLTLSSASNGPAHKLVHRQTSRHIHIKQTNIIVLSVVQSEGVSGQSIALQASPGSNSVGCGLGMPF